MKTQELLFLDFDGVVRLSLDKSVPTHESVIRLEEFLLSRPELLVVFSTAWRNVMDFDTLVSVFPPSIQKRFIGKTQKSPEKFQGSREVEIADYIWQYLHSHPEIDKVCWVALDDRVELFSPGCPNLVLIKHLNAAWIHNVDMKLAAQKLDEQNPNIIKKKTNKIKPRQK